MRLDLNCIEILDPESEERPEWISVEGKAYEGKKIPVDNHQYGKCVFRNCNFLYSGGPFGFSECEVEDDYILSLTGSARNTARLMETLQKHSPPGPPYC